MCIEAAPIVELTPDSQCCVLEPGYNNIHKGIHLSHHTCWKQWVTLLGLLGCWSPLVPVGPLWRCCWPVLPPHVPLISLESLLSGCKHSIALPSVGIFEGIHRHRFFNIMRYTVPTVHNSLGVKISPYVQPWCSRSDVQWVSRLPCDPLTVTCHCKPTASVQWWAHVFQIRILPFPSVASKMPPKFKLFSKFVWLLLFVGTFPKRSHKTA